MTTLTRTDDSLSSWAEGVAKTSILDFVARVTEEGGADYVPPGARVAVFDNDGTLWCERPMYIQLDHILRKLATQAANDPTLQAQQPWKAAYEKDFAWIGEAVTMHYRGDDSRLGVLLHGLLNLFENRHVEAVEDEAAEFVQNESHPTLDRPFADCIYPPMVELLRHLEAHDFTCYIVSGGGRDFMRGISDQLYGIPRQRVVGSTVAYRYEASEDGGKIVQRAELDIVDDGPAKAIQIWNVIARRPILAAGNSNGDIEMMRFAGGGDLPALRLLILHDDAEREFDYTAGAEKALDVAEREDWTVVSIKDDWERVFPA